MKMSKIEKEIIKVNNNAIIISTLGSVAVGGLSAYGKFGYNGLETGIIISASAVGAGALSLLITKILAPVAHNYYGLKGRNMLGMILASSWAGVSYLVYPLYTNSIYMHTDARYNSLKTKYESFGTTHLYKSDTKTSLLVKAKTIEQKIRNLEDSTSVTGSVYSTIYKNTDREMTKIKNTNRKKWIKTTHKVLAKEYGCHLPTRYKKLLICIANNKFDEVAKSDINKISELKRELGLTKTKYQNEVLKEKSSLSNQLSKRQEIKITKNAINKIEDNSEVSSVWYTVILFYCIGLLIEVFYMNHKFLLAYSSKRNKQKAEKKIAEEQKRKDEEEQEQKRKEEKKRKDEYDKQLQQIKEEQNKLKSIEREKKELDRKRKILVEIPNPEIYEFLLAYTTDKEYEGSIKFKKDLTPFVNLGRTRQGNPLALASAIIGAFIYIFMPTIHTRKIEKYSDLKIADILYANGKSNFQTKDEKTLVSIIGDVFTPLGSTARSLKNEYTKHQKINPQKLALAFLSKFDHMEQAQRIENLNIFWLKRLTYEFIDIYHPNYFVKL